MLIKMVFTLSHCIRNAVPIIIEIVVDDADSSLVLASVRDLM